MEQEFISYTQDADTESQCDLGDDSFRNYVEKLFDIEKDSTIPDDDRTAELLFEDTGEILEDGRRIFVLSKKSRQYIKTSNIACMCHTCISLSIS